MTFLNFLTAPGGVLKSDLPGEFGGLVLACGYRKIVADLMISDKSRANRCDGQRGAWYTALSRALNAQGKTHAGNFVTETILNTR